MMFIIDSVLDTALLRIVCIVDSGIAARGRGWVSEGCVERNMEMLETLMPNVFCRMHSPKGEK